MLAISNRAKLIPHVIKTLEFDHSESPLDRCVLATHMDVMAIGFCLCGVPITPLTVGYASWILAGGVSYALSSS